MAVLNPVLESNAASLHDSFVTAAPFRHVVIDDFFSDEFCDDLLREFPAFSSGAATNELGETGKKAVHEKISKLGPVYKSLDACLKSKEFLHFVGSVTGIEKLLYDPYYVGGGTHENLSGQSLDPHVDFNYHPLTGWHRRLNLIVYLNREWRPEWGGAIQLHGCPWDASKDEVKTVLPGRNRAVLFETNEYSWHGFEEIQPADDGGLRSRKSIAVYFYTKSRPRGETFPSHSTHYVHRPLPRHLKPGHRLTGEDVEIINRAVQQRTDWIKYLYAREMKLASMHSPNVLKLLVRKWLYIAVEAVMPGAARRMMSLLRRASSKFSGPPPDD